ncbi:YtzI protein [Lysinibacillus sp. MHQ-1]|nr:YtzI protein [Lysinibacillus sp. MHQ-1]
MMSLTTLLIVAIIIVIIITIATVISVNRAYAFKHTVDEKTETKLSSKGKLVGHS